METCSDTGIEVSSLGIGWAAIEGPSVIEVTAGDVIARAREEVVRARTGDLVCVAPGSRAELRAACGSARVKRPTLAPALVASALALAGSSRAQEAVGFRVDPRDSDRARQGARLIRELERAHSAGKGGHLRRIARCVELLALALESEGPQAPGAAVASRRSGRRMRFLGAIEELESTSLDEITLTSFARRAGISERHASRLFQVELGRTFREHLAGLRLERAKALLRATEMSVIEVAGETGWSSLAHFNAVFRRRVGATPTQFRIGSIRSEARRAAS